MTCKGSEEGWAESQLLIVPTPATLNVQVQKKSKLDVVGGVIDVGGKLIE